MVVGNATGPAEKFRILIEHQVGGLDDPSHRPKIAIEHKAVPPRLPQGPSRTEVRLHIRPTESIDGLLRISDHSQVVAGAVTPLDEDLPEDRPLNIVGILEFVDQRMPVAAAQGSEKCASGWPWISERFGHQAEHVREVEQAGITFALGRTLADKRQKPLNQQYLQGNGGFVQFANRAR